MKKYIFIVITVLLGTLLLGACSKEQSQENTKEIPKIEQIQTPQALQTPQTASTKYESYNYYKNNVTEYLEIKADGSVFYSTSTRPNQIGMIVTAGDKDGYFESFIEFPKGTGDGQRYGINKSGGNLMVGIPNTDAPPQVYTRKNEASQNDDLQVAQPQQKTEIMAEPQLKLREGGEIYESYNYYGNKITEYLQVAGPNVYYSTSARPKEIKMIVSKAGFSGYILQFPKGAGDNQRYGLKKTEYQIIITTPKGKKQKYARKYE